MRRLCPGVGAAVLVVGLVLSAAGGVRAQAVEWTLERCVGAAVESSRLLRAGAARRDAARAAADEAAAVRWPAVQLQGSYAYTSETMALDLPLMGPVDPPRVQFGDGHVYDLALVANVPLFTGGALAHSARAKESAHRAAEYEIETAGARVRYEVRKAYFETLGAMAEADAAEIARSRLARHVGDLEGAIRSGAATEERRLEALSMLRQAELRRLALEARAAGLRLALGNLVGRPGDEVTPAGGLDGSILEPRGRPDAQGRLGQGPEVSALGARVEEMDEAARAARGAFLPALSAQVGYHYGKPGVDMIRDEWMDYARAGVQLSWWLWDRGARSRRVRQAVGARAALEEQREQLRDALRTQEAAARATWESAREQVEKAEDRAVLEGRRRELVSGRYAQAAASETEWLDAEDDLAMAEIERATASTRLRLAEAELLYILER